MSIDRVVMAFAGTMILLSLVPGPYLGPSWSWVTALVGANLLRSARTGFCPLASTLRRAGRRPGAAF